jgi:predicted nuclease with TOPRIM domain
MNSNIKGTGLQDLYDALLRLVDNKPMRIGKGFKISLRTVALEAGKDPSLIRKDRDIYDHLIADIEHYAALQKEKSAKKNGQVAELKARIAQLRNEAERFEDLWKAALARELFLLEQLDEYEQRWKKYTNVVDFVPNNSPANH